ncbi:MAG: UDP-N-acetylmuramoyl-L-alanine--D-glutamate ligase [candidate division Zixibacteria bacterium]|nr:UDP-N-acetylmuramoyl-L-alanine--D-glutamate ligase [candidate division Zixibacteria bacterium]
MTVEERIKNRKIGIIGMARSGMAAAFLADQMGGKPFVSDTKAAEHLSGELERLRKNSIPFETGGHTDRLLQCDYVVISPGVPLSAGIVEKVRAKGIPIFSEIEFASWACRGRIIGVTGSNGKTTTTTLLGHIFSAAGFDTFVCGNIGFPFAEIVAKIPEEGIAVVEVSNFQLETIADFRPAVAVILNLTPDHLDRHASFEEYKNIKYRITENQGPDERLVVNLDDPEIVADNVASRASRVYFTAADRNDAAAFVRGDTLWGKYANGSVPIIDCRRILIPGPHNLQNAAAAVAVAVQFDIRPEVLKGVLEAFPGVEHRLEKVGKVAGIDFVNDSKATNVDSVCYALRSIDTPIHLIAGGRDKGSPYEPIAKWGKGKIKSVVVIGEAGDKIFHALGQSFPVQFADSLEEAVRKSFEAAFPGETVLLSPGCASFDMFENFEQRGKVFKDAVANLRNGKRNNETISN